MTVWPRYLARRLGAILVVLLGVCTLVFFVTRELGTPVYLLVGQQADPEVVAALEREIGLDKPLHVQYVNYLGDLARGDLGVSRRTGHAVTEDIRDYLPATVELVAAAMFLTVLVAVPLGIAGAVRPGRLRDRAGQGLVYIGVSLPNFWIGLILIYLLYYKLGVFPTPVGRLDDDVAPPREITGLLLFDSAVTGRFDAFWSALRHLVLPAATLALVSIPATLQITRGAFIEILRSDYVRTARAFGMPVRMVHLKYALKNAIVPLVTVLAMSFGFLMSGTVLVEKVFAWPGIGLYALESMNNFDYEPVIGVVLLSALFYAIAYLVADLVSFAVDPRIRMTPDGSR